MGDYDSIKQWVLAGNKHGATHVIIVCDTYDEGDDAYYPVYVKRGENPIDVIRKYNGLEMQRVMECYSLALDIDQQMSERRTWHTETY